MIKHLEAEHEALLQACLAYLRVEAFVVGYLIQVEAMNGAFARIQVMATMGCADSATGFARKRRDGWSILAIGTSFTAEFFRVQGVPATLQVGFAS